MKTKFKLGPIQTQWLKDLRQYSERQISGRLGEKLPEEDPRKYCLCCLGQALVTESEMTGKDLYFNDNGSLCDSDDLWKSTLGMSWENFRFRQSNGPIDGAGIHWNNINYTTLDAANDAGIPWPEIADFIEENPERVFTKSV